MNVTVDSLLLIIGQQQVELVMLRKQLTDLLAERAKVKIPAALEARNGTPADGVAAEHAG